MGHFSVASERGKDNTEACVYLIALLFITQLSNEATIMSSASEVNVDIRDFLMSINLEQYLSHFREFGFNTVKDCAAINDSVLHKIGISPTGHRRRIIKQLQLILSKMQDIPIYANIHKTKKNNETSEDLHAPSSGQDTCAELSNSCRVQAPSLVHLETVSKSCDHNGITVESSQSSESDHKLSLPEHNCPIPEEKPHLNLGSFQDSSSGRENIKVESLIIKKTLDFTVEEQADDVDSVSENTNKLPKADPVCLSFLGCSATEANSGNGTNGLLERPPAPPFFKFEGEMVVNDLYVPSSPFLPPMRSRSKLVSRPSRSFLLRHRPVPEIPGSTKGISGR